MSEDRRDILRRKYLSLGLGELAAAVVFVVVAFTVAIPRLVGADDQAALWSALVPLSVVLVQGGAYWLSARAWVARAPMPTSLATLYRAFRIADVVLLAAGLVGIVPFLRVSSLLPSPTTALATHAMARAPTHPRPAVSGKVESGLDGAVDRYDGISAW